MIVTLQVTVYALLAVLLTFGGNLVCKWVLGLSATKPPPETEETITLRAGRMIGILEGILIFVGLTASSWEILAGLRVRVSHRARRPLRGLGPMSAENGAPASAFRQ